MAKRIYLDYASLTPIDPRVLRVMKAFSAPEYANPSSLYKEGVAAKKALQETRVTIAAFIHGHADEIVFTSGGTEANGLALEGAGRAAHRAGFAKPHLIISSIEHSSIIEAANMMEKQGVEVTRLSVDASGHVDLEELKKAIKPETYMVSIMTANNEIGTVQPIREIAKIIRDYRKTNSRIPAFTGMTEKRPDLGNTYPLFHTDAAQAALHCDLNVEKLGIDLMTLDGSKVYGPRGIGCLYVKRNTPIEPIIYGGGQEKGLRSGTENIPAIKGFAKALEIASDKRENERSRISKLKADFLKGLQDFKSDIVVNPQDREGGSREISLNGESDENFRHFRQTSETAGNGMSLSSLQSPHILNVSIPGIDNEFFVLQLDAKGIACSTKSSCLKDQDESYVLKAIGADSKTSVRFSFGRWTKKGDVKRALKMISNILNHE